MVLSLCAPVARADRESQSPAGGAVPFEVLDPASLSVKKLGALDEAIPEEQGIRYQGDDLVRVSIFLEGKATLEAGFAGRDLAENAGAMSYRQSLKDGQAVMQQRIEETTGEPLDVKWNLTLAANAISANVRYKDIEAIAAIPGVEAVEQECYYEAPAPALEPNTAVTKGDMTGTEMVWSAGYTGAGRKVAIIDTGIDTTHLSFAEESFLHAIEEVRQDKDITLMTAADIPGGLSAPGIYVNAKIPFAYNYVDKNTTNLGHDTDGRGNHGSHVAGIAGANRYVYRNNEFLPAADATGAVGMAPDAQLILMKVFGASGGAYDSDYMTAIEDAMLLGCDAANLSLGSAAPGFTYSLTYQGIMNSLTGEANEGMVVVTSAGNSGSFQKDLYIEDVKLHTGGSPGTFINSLGIASADNIGSIGYSVTFNDGHQAVYVESNSTGAKLRTIVGEYEYVYLDCNGTEADYAAAAAALSLDGKVLIVNRGEINFALKAENAIPYGPAALLVANNQPGTIRMSLDAYTGSFPVVSFMQADAQRVKDESSASGTIQLDGGSYPYYTGTVTVTDTVSAMEGKDRADANVSSFSSWGVPGSLLMKPEITAPGGNIWSVYGTSNDSTDIADGAGPEGYGPMSGTSMAAPHITGITAVLAQYLAENPIADRNQKLAENYSTRAVLQSLLMSTATPMINDERFVSLLQQGAGLVDTSRAMASGSVVMVEEGYLTSMTGANKDGKVKIELGEDALRSGEYEIGLRIYNISDLPLTFIPDLKLFTQDRYEDGGHVYLDLTTVEIPGVQVEYIWEGDAPQTPEHDVNRDGHFNDKDPIAVLNYLAGNLTAEELDLEAAEMDGQEGVTSYDAHLLLALLEEEVNEGSADGEIQPGESRGVRISIVLAESTRAMLAENYPNGNYLEGFLYLRGEGTSGEGGIVADEHSVPIFGFYGNWTDPSMFDNNSFTDTLYGSDKVPYSGNQKTNYLILDYANGESAFAGNPYMVEESFPADRLALRSDTVMKGFAYSLIRDAANTAISVNPIVDGTLSYPLYQAMLNSNQGGLYFHVNNGKWMNNTVLQSNLNRSPVNLGLEEGDSFRVGFYAIPEYYGMVNTFKKGGDIGHRNAPILSDSDFADLLYAGTFGSGAAISFDFVIDDTHPVMGTPQIEGTALTLEISDDRNLAYVALMSLDGETIYEEYAPGTAEYTLQTDIARLAETAQGYVALFAADYAGNEVAKAIQVNDNTVAEKTAYVLTDTFTPGREYIIVNTNTAGVADTFAIGHALNSSNVEAPKAAPVTVNPADADFARPYITVSNAPAEAIWLAGEANGDTSLKNGEIYLGYAQSGYSWNLKLDEEPCGWKYSNNKLYLEERTSYGSVYIYSLNATYYSYYENWRLGYDNNLASGTNFYLYEKVTETYVQDPYTVSHVAVIPGTVGLYVGDSTALSVKTSPMTAEDRSVIWDSADPTIASVDEHGVVTALAKGTTTITAAATTNPDAVGSCTVIVEKVEKELDAVIWDEAGGEFFGRFNTSELAEWTKKHETDYQFGLQNAFMLDENTLLAATASGSGSELFTVDRSTFALTPMDPAAFPMFGLADAPDLEGFDVDFVFVFASYLVGATLTPNAEGQIGDVAENLIIQNPNGDYFSGIALKETTSTGAVYYLLDEKGVIWEAELYSSPYFSWLTFRSVNEVISTGIEGNFSYQGFYYDGSYIYWTYFNDATETTELIIVDPALKTVYHAGFFNQENLLMVPGLYQDGVVGPAAAPGEELPEAERQAREADERALRAAMEEAGVFISKETLKEEAESYKNRGGAGSGSTQAVVTQWDRSERISGTDKPESLIVEGLEGAQILESVPVTNGVMEIRYNNAEMSFESITGDAHFAYRHDGEQGLILLAYAAAEEMEAESLLFTLNFTAPCETQYLQVKTLERNQELSLEEVALLPVEGEGHIWGEPSWEWAEDASWAKAT